MTHPRAYATVTGPSATYISPDGHSEPLLATSEEDIRHAVVRRASDDARRAGEPVELVTSGDRGVHHILVEADGALSPLTLATGTTVVAGDVQIPPMPPAPTRPAAEPAAVEVESDVPDAKSPVATEPHMRTSFIQHASYDTTRASGWRGALAHIGITVGPSVKERRRDEWLQIVSRQWAGCRTIAVANGKGGVGKTMTTAMLAAVYARHGGGNVLAWDNNDTRGTLGWRTETGLYDTTLRDLLPAAEELLAPTAAVSDIARFVHHQSTDRYDVLRSNPELLATHQRIEAAEFDLLMQVAARYYRLVIFDSGNDESADRWLRMVDSSTQLVIPTLAAPESAESAALLLDALRERDEHSAQLAANAVVVVTQAEPATREVRRIADGFAGQVRAVDVIFYDPALKSGPLRFDALRPGTRDAWLRVAASAAAEL